MRLKYLISSLLILIAIIIPMLEGTIMLIIALGQHPVVTMIAIII
jgi:hypothetical protein